MKKRIDGNIKMLRKYINVLKRTKRDELRKGGKTEQLAGKYNTRRKTNISVVEVLK